MRKIILLSLILIALPITFSLNYFCYQEHANVSTSCGGLATGTYLVNGSFANNATVTDGDFATGTTANNGIHTYLYVNYTKPFNFLSTSTIWQVKFDTSIPYDRNYTDIPTDCWNQNPVQLYIHSERVVSDDQFFYCRNSTAWDLMFTRVNSVWLWEDGMHWDLQYYYNFSFTKSVDILLINEDNTSTKTSIKDLILYDSNLSSSKNSIHFNKINNIYTQFYEFEHTSITTDTTFDTYVDLNSTTEFWIKVLDKGGSVRPDTRITLFCSNTTYDTGTFQTCGQRFTNDEGLVMFYLNNQLSYKLVAVLDGYGTVTSDFINEVQINANTRSTPEYLFMESEDGDNYAFTINFPFNIINKSENIVGSGSSNSYLYSDFKYTTQYRVDNSLPQKTAFDATAYLWDYDEKTHVMILVADTDFDSSSTDNVTVHVYVNNTLALNRTLTYYNYTSENYNATMLNPKTFSYSSSKIYYALLWIGLIFLVITLQFFIQSENNTIGFHVFLIGCIIMGMMSIRFLPLTILVIMYYFLKTIKKFIGVSV